MAQSVRCLRNISKVLFQTEYAASNSDVQFLLNSATLCQLQSYNSTLAL